MGERKVLNKYIPADFDPSLVPRGKKLSSKDGTVPVRMMLPFSLQCSVCKNFLYRGRKFNSKKEPMGGPDGRYLNIQRWRFYIKCTHCARPITFCTDPKNADYEMESGGTRNYEVYKDKDKQEESAAAEKEEAEKEDPMKALENRVLDSQREMADMDNLEEIRAMNARHVQIIMSAGSGGGAGVAGDLEAAKAVLDRVRGKKGLSNDGDDEDEKEHLLTAEDEALVKSIRFGNSMAANNHREHAFLRRLNEEDERKLEERRRKETAQMEERYQRRLLLSSASASASASAAGSGGDHGGQQRIPAMPVIKVKRKRPAAAPATEDDGAEKKKSKAKMMPPPSQETVSSGGGGTGLAGLLGGYGSSDDSD